MSSLRLDQVDTEIDLEALLVGFVPTPRFAAVSFASYRPNPDYPSQGQALDYLEHFSARLNTSQPTRLPWLPDWLGHARPSGPRGVYLDGGFGVGKTHLLAATYHAAQVPKLYLSFSELAYTMVQLGLPACIDQFRRYRLISLDELELDDIANTRMAAAFLRGVTAGASGSRIVTTSNTQPSDLGQGRFAAGQFAREIGEIAATFVVLAVDGDDYRHRPWTSPERTADPDASCQAGLISSADLRAAFAAARDSSGASVFVSHSELLALLARLYPIRYTRLLDSIGALFIDDLAPMPDQDQALRFVHFIDKAYDLQVPVAASASVPLVEIFAPEYRDRGYAKKYQRCLSRLGELFAESARSRSEWA